MDSTTTTPTVDPGELASLDSQFTHANLFGVYLTLVFCVLTQPLGSLLMGFPLELPRSLPARLSLFPLHLWRLNPIACGAEGWLILAILVKRAIEVGRLTPRNTPPRLRWERFLDWMHVGAMALLIIRMPQTDKNKRKICKALSSFDPTADESRGDEIAGSFRLLNRHQDAANALEDGDGTLHTNEAPRRSINDVLRPGIVTSNHGWVDAVTVLSIVTVVVKLAAVTMPWQLRIALLFMVLGWFAVALLTLLGHSRDFESVDKREVAWETQRLAQGFPWLSISPSRGPGQPSSYKLPWQAVVLGTFVLPVLVYICYTIAFSFPMNADTTHMRKIETGEKEVHEFYGLRATPAGFFIFGPRIIIYYFLLFLLIAPAPLFLIMWVIPTVADCGPCFFFLYGMTAMPALLLGYIFLGYFIVDKYPDECALAMSVAIFVFILVLKAGFFIIIYATGSQFWFFWLLNPIIVGLGVPTAFELYLPKDSSKPGWLDWLG